MRVRDIMKAEARVCSLQTNLADAGKIMSDVGCGVLPVVDPMQRVVGVITDRDICMVVSKRDVKPSDLKVQDVISGEAYTCMADEEIGEALHTMREFAVRRLPVVDETNRLQGILSLDDIVLEARAIGSEMFTGPFYSDIARTLKAICSHPTPATVGA
jgi:CBS-domain-containing membrane protein